MSTERASWPVREHEVLAILAGTKTQHRVLVKVDSNGRLKLAGSTKNWHLNDPECIKACPYGQPGDQLWVREAWSTHERFDYVPPAQLTTISINYLADGKIETGKGRPSIHMPRWASRITLEITGVLLEHLKDISEEDAKAEGAIYHDGHGIGSNGWRHAYERVHSEAKISFAELWDSTRDSECWDENPLVWVIEFKRVGE